VAAALGAVDGDLEVVEGDLREPGAGLGPGPRDRLRECVTTVFNCAGETAFFPEDPVRFRAGHVDGPVSLLEALAGGRLGAWAQLSTAYVCGRRTGTVREAEGDVGQEFHNPYERVKLEAETAVRAAGARRGVDVRTFRPSAVVGGRGLGTAGSAPSSLFGRFIRLAAAAAELTPGGRVPLRIEAAPRAPFNIVPLGYVARAVVVLARCGASARQTFHLVVPDPPSQEMVLGMIMDHLGLRGFRLVNERLATSARPTPLERRVRGLLGRYRDYLGHDVRFDDSAARRALARHGLAPAALRVGDVHRLIARALGHRPARGPGRPGS
jgi:nucleoside-diphosphate-sugar epimerase